jgi:hypothetical protein
MTYRATKKATKIWSEQALAEKERIRIEKGEEIGVRPALAEPDYYMKIVIERSATKETAVFECFEGTRCDNYRVYCNGTFQGIQSITTLTANIRKALPRFKSSNHEY